MEIASKLNIETVTDSMIHKKLSLDRTSERQLEMFPSEILERYHGKQSFTAKPFRTRDILDPFFRDVAKFLLEVGCVHVNAYGMPKDSRPGNKQSKQWNFRTVLKRRRDQHHKMSRQHHLSANLR